MNSPIEHLKYYQPSHVHFVLNGGLGDVIMALPILQYAIKNIFKNSFRVSCPPEYDFLIRDLIDSKNIHNYYDMVLWSNSTILSKVTRELFTPRTNLTVYASLCMLEKIIPYEQMSLPLWPTLNFYDENDIQAWKDFEEYVLKFDLSKAVVLPVSFRSHSKKWKTSLLNQFVDYLVDQGYIPICVGGSTSKDNPRVVEKFSSKSTPVPEKAIDLVGKISIKQTLALMQRSVAVVGVTGGLIQLAALTQKPIVVMITYTDVFHSLFWRDGEFAKHVWPILPDSKKCAFCVNDYLVNNLDYNDCLLNKNFQCTEFEFNALRIEFENAIQNKTSTLQKTIAAKIKEDFG